MSETARDRLGGIISERDLAVTREEATKETLRGIGAPTHTEDGMALTANGMLEDWIAGRRAPGWRGPDPVRDHGPSWEDVRPLWEAAKHPSDDNAVALLDAVRAFPVPEEWQR